MNAIPEPTDDKQNAEQPSFVFLRATPTDMMDHPPLASSLQSFETCLFLIALGRFPSALVTCAAAIESVIKAKLGTPPGDRVELWELIQIIRRQSATLRLCSEDKLTRFRELRNRVVHYGYTPQDDEVCAEQLLETGFPFLEKCYRELFAFDLICRPGGGRAAGLAPEVVRQYEVCREVYQRAKHLQGIGYSYCLNSLAHHIRFALKETTMSVTEAQRLETADDMGMKYEYEARAKERILRQLKGPTWEFDCPICGGDSTMIAELNEDELRKKQVSVRWCFCVCCEMLVSGKNPYLADQLLQVHIDVETKIRKEFGIW